MADFKCDISLFSNALDWDHRVGLSFKQTLLRVAKLDGERQGYVVDEQAFMEAIHRMAGFVVFSACGVEYRIRFDSAETLNQPLSAIVEKFEAPAWRGPA